MVVGGLSSERLVVVSLRVQVLHVLLENGRSGGDSGMLGFAKLEVLSHYQKPIGFIPDSNDPLHHSGSFVVAILLSCGGDDFPHS